MTFLDDLRAVLAEDEACVPEIYADHLNHLTCGIGHLIVEGDREYGQPVGTAISDQRVTELFMKDVTTALRDARVLHPDFDDLPGPAKIVVASLAFQLGLPRYQLFQKHHQGIKDRDWSRSAAEIRNSRLYQQTPERTERHAVRLEGITHSE